MKRCTCGDVNCWVCGPLQGYDPIAEIVADWIYEVILNGFDCGSVKEDLAGHITDKLSEYDFAQEVYEEALKWSKEKNSGKDLGDD